MLPDRVTGVEREVDIVVEGTVSGCRVLMGIECQETARKSDLVWVQRQAGKHERLTDKLVLVSASAFTKTARQEAKVRGIDAISFADAINRDWSAYIDKLTDLIFGLFELTPKTYTVQVALTAENPEPPISGIEPFLSQGDAESVLLSTAFKAMLRDGTLSRQIMDHWYAAPPGSRKSNFDVEFSFKPNDPHTWVLTQPPGRQWRVEELRGKVSVSTRAVPLPMTPAQFMDARVMHGTAEFDDGRKVRLLLTERPGETPEATLAMSASRDGPEQRASITIIVPQKPQSQ